MKKLFCVKTKSGKVYSHKDATGETVTYFESKQQARDVRDLKNSEAEGHPSAGYYVGIGPDHFRFA